MQVLYLVTGGCGFIGSCFVLRARAAGIPVIDLDRLTYCGNPENLAPLDHDPGHVLVQGDIANRDLVAYLLRTHRPSAIVHFAAESHVDRSISDPGVFVRTNVMGPPTCCIAPWTTGRALPGRKGRPSGSCMSPPTRSSAPWGRMTRLSGRIPPTPPTAPIPPARRPATIWRGPSAIPTACPCW